MHETDVSVYFVCCRCTCERTCIFNVIQYCWYMQAKRTMGEETRRVQRFELNCNKTSRENRGSGNIHEYDSRGYDYPYVHDR